MSKSVLVAVANIGEQNIPMDIILKWEPEKLSFVGDTVFFKVDDTFFSMKKNDFCNIFTEKCAYIKY
jgi:predicted Holliday junction resolvase-like endonuclease